MRAAGNEPMADSPPLLPWREVLRPLESSASEPERAWQLDRGHFDQHVRVILPPKHEPRALLKHANDELGEERCARAHDRLCSAPLPEAVTRAVQGLWREIGSRLEHGLIVQPSLIAEGRRGVEAALGSSAWGPQAVVGVLGPEATSAAIARAWAWLSLHGVVAELARLGARDASVAIMLRELPDPAHAATLEDVAEPASPTQALPAGASRDAPAGVLGTDAPRAEIILGLAGDAPLSAASASIALPLVREAMAACLEALGCKPPRADGWVAMTPRGVAVDTPELARVLAIAPAHGAELGLLALGGDSERAIGRLAQQHDHPSHRLRRVRAALEAARTALGVDHDFARMPPRLVQDVDALENMDLGLLPTDATPTTLEHAIALLRQAGKLWARGLGAEIAVHAALGALVRRRVPEAPAKVGTFLLRGRSASSGAALALAFDQLAGLMRADPGAAELVRAGQIRRAGDLPKGRPRTGLEQFLAEHGQLALGVFELAQPRWSEDAGELARLLRVLLGTTPQPAAARRHDQARADAEGELALYEPKLSLVERALARTLRNRAGAIARWRRELDGATLRALAVTRRILLDVDRRLRRIDPRIPEGGALHCSVSLLERALCAELPELGPLIRMRVAQRGLAATAAKRTEPGPAEPASELAGIGVSPGLGMGRARVLHGPLPATLDPDEVVVIPHADPAASPLYLRAAALVVETGGLFAPAAGIARDLALPAVMSVARATTRLRQGELVRVDGTRGSVERLAGP